QPGKLLHQFFQGRGEVFHASFLLLFVCQQQTNEFQLFSPRRIPDKNILTQPPWAAFTVTDKGPRRSPAKRVRWGEEEQTERRELSPKAEANTAQFVLTRWWEF
ncbi:MAG: hypothetical protein ACI4OU_02825, partial [Candidatus Enterenecus sp.]